MRLNGVLIKGALSTTPPPPKQESMEESWNLVQTGIKSNTEVSELWNHVEDEGHFCGTGTVFGSLVQINKYIMLPNTEISSEMD